MSKQLIELQNILDEMEINVGLIPPYEIGDKEFKDIKSFVEDFIEYHKDTIMENELHKLYKGSLLTESKDKTYLELLNDLL